jgi:hypothetical protein
LPRPAIFSWPYAYNYSEDGRVPGVIYRREALEPFMGHALSGRAPQGGPEPVECALVRQVVKEFPDFRRGIWFLVS